MLNIIDKKYLQFYAENFCLSKPVFEVSILSLSCLVAVLLKLLYMYVLFYTIPLFFSQFCGVIS